MLVTGSSGYVANYIIKTLARTNPQLQIIGMSRSAKPRDSEVQQFSSVKFVKGDCLDADSFRDHLEGVDAIIHTVGTLIEKKQPDLTYEAMNRDTAINMAGELQDIAFKEGTIKNFVMISSAKAPPFLKKYITTK